MLVFYLRARIVMIYKVNISTLGKTEVYPLDIGIAFGNELTLCVSSLSYNQVDSLACLYYVKKLIMSL